MGPEEPPPFPRFYLDEAIYSWSLTMARPSVQTAALLAGCIERIEELDDSLEHQKEADLTPRVQSIEDKGNDF
ncbi:hypothetical protein CC1G_04433 [Coprinopsis cinerea okayama7|uniref:Uncharacterized protein n=1 Tax=Coprinopsis cinerea (strain Okayama-7 / 130 / ATCC MYA-4618 / FGSC 9003) TaxID=240176 RepID=A8N0L2_COPC7|nr:hypothetical protein CC1G_04433 [Coprinopsis cinerea okayama7\|eukprot:XP_001828462.1 hypothetical protein CC1G_04433 [Coprinopsis cinerea okayama7\